MRFAPAKRSELGNAPYPLPSPSLAAINPDPLPDAEPNPSAAPYQALQPLSDPLDLAQRSDNLTALAGE